MYLMIMGFLRLFPSSACSWKSCYDPEQLKLTVKLDTVMPMIANGCSLQLTIMRRTDARKP